MLTKLLRFEGLYHLKQPSFIIMFLALFGYGIAINADTLGVGMELLNINSPYRLSYFIALTSVLGTFVAMIFCVNSLLRDKDYRFDGIVGVLAIKQRLMSRVIAIFISTLCVVSVLSIGLMLGLFAPDLDPDRLASFSLSNYLWPWLLFVLPNAIITTSLLVVVTLKKQHAFVTYITAILLFIAFWIAMVFIGAPISGSMVFRDPSIVNVFALLDPFGTSAFFEQNQFWTPQQKNQQHVSLTGALLFNRIIWLVIALAAFLYSKKVVLQHPPSTKNLMVATPPKTAANKSDETACLSAPEIILKSINSNSFQYHLNTLLALSTIEIKQILSQWSFRVFTVLVTVLALIGMLMAIGTFSSGVFSGSYATTSLLIGYGTEAFIPVVTAFIIFYSAEKIWQEKLLLSDPFIDSTPVASATIYGAKLLSLFFIPLFLVTLHIVTSIIFQISNGYFRFEMTHYFSLYYFTAMPVLIQTVLIFFIQARLASSRFANKYLGMMVSALVIVFLSNSSGLFGFEHPLLNINQLPSLLRIDSDLVGYGDFAIKFHYLAAIWSLLALIIACLTIKKWNRGEWLKGKFLSGKWLSGNTTLSSNTINKKMPAVMLPVALISFTILAAVIHLTMPLSNDYQSAQQTLDEQALYERKYKQYQDLAVPQVSDITLALDFYPKQRRYTVTADTLLLNTGEQAMYEIFVTTRVPLQSINIAGAAISLTESTVNWTVYLFTLAKPLLPGHSIAMHYELQQSSNAFAINKGIVNNGSYLNQSQFEPLLGYVERNEIQDKFEREKRGLIKKLPLIIDRTKPSSYGKFVSQKRRVEAILSTSAQQTAVTSGQLLKRWQQDGRHYFHYKTKQAIYPLVGYFSADYETKIIEHNGVMVEMYFHGDHQQNINEMLRATKATLDYATRHLGDYAYDSLRILEVPAYHPFGGKAAAGVIALSENLYTENYRDDAAINNPARNTIHEVLHQWWGEKLVPKITQGEGVLVESLTKYMEAVILGEMYGNDMASHLRKYSQRRYFSGRTYARTVEVGIVDAYKETYLNYGKGPIVFAALRELLGEQQINAAFKQLIDTHQHTLSATTDDLLNALYKISNPQQAVLIKDWLTKVIEYDLSIDKAVVSQLSNGRYQVLINVNALRLNHDKQGLISEIGIDEPISFALFSAHPDVNNVKTLHIESRNISQQKSLITLIVDVLPKYVMIDPDYTRLDKKLSDNISIIIAKIGATNE